MITPGKHLDLDVSVLRAGAVMLAILKRARVIPLPKLQEKLITAIGSDGELIFMPAVNFLFLLGRLKYLAKNDSLEYVKVELSRSPSSPNVDTI